MDLYNLLRYDHETVKSLFRDLEKTASKDVKKREGFFSEINMELTLHAFAEEKFLYPKLMDHKESRELTLDAIKQHNAIKNLVKELAALPKDSEVWDAKLKILVENVERHVDEEENRLFKQAKKVLSPEDAEEIADDIESFKEEQAELVGESE